MSALVSRLEPQCDGYIATLPESRGTDGLFTFMSFGYMILCSEPSVAVVKTALVHNDDPRRHRTARHRRDSVSPLEPQSDGFIGTFPESRKRGDLFGSMGLCCIFLCSGASVGIPKAAMVHQPDLSSHRTDRERRALVSPLEPRSDGFIATFPGPAVAATCWPS